VGAGKAVRLKWASAATLCAPKSPTLQGAKNLIETANMFYQGPRTAPGAQLLGVVQKAAKSHSDIFVGHVVFTAPGSTPSATNSGVMTWTTKSGITTT
jgi:hypothetical protein